MKMFLSICAALLGLFLGTAQAMPENPLISSANYAVQKGDTLTAVAKKFSGVTASGIAKASGIANPNLIYPGMVLTIPVAEGSARATAAQTASVAMREEMLPHAARRESPNTTCAIAPLLERLLYPTEVSKKFKEMIAEHRDVKMGLPFGGVVAHNDSNYYLLVEKHCVATKIVDTLRIIPLKVAEDTARMHENTTALTPRQRVEMATAGIREANRNRETREELNTLLARIKKELQAIMGDDEDVTPLVIPLALAIIRKAETGEAAVIRLKK